MYSGGHTMARVSPKKLAAFRLDPELIEGLQDNQGPDRSADSRASTAGDCGLAGAERGRKDGPQARPNAEAVLKQVSSVNCRRALRPE